jgi:hemin uptake protein HemP
MASVAGAGNGRASTRAAALAQHATCIGLAFAAARGDTQVVLEVDHVLAAEAYGAADFAFGDGVADADVHVVWGVPANKVANKNDSQYDNTKMSEKSNSPLSDAPGTPEAAAALQRVVESRDILGGKAEVVIRHEGRTYRLRRTRLGKLILTA